MTTVKPAHASNLKGTCLVIGLASALLFSGCSQKYVMKTSSGARITTASKPKLKNGYYTFKDAQGHTQQIGAGRVLEIAPESMSTDDKSKFKTASPK